MQFFYQTVLPFEIKFNQDITKCVADAVRSIDPYHLFNSFSFQEQTLLILQTDKGLSLQQRFVTSSARVKKKKKCVINYLHLIFPSCSCSTHPTYLN